MNQGRQPKGIPSGGEFTAQARDEAPEIDLGETPEQGAASAATDQGEVVQEWTRSTTERVSWSTNRRDALRDLNRERANAIQGTGYAASMNQARRGYVRNLAALRSELERLDDAGFESWAERVQAGADWHRARVASACDVRRYEDEIRAGDAASSSYTPGARLSRACERLEPHLPATRHQAVRDARDMYRLAGQQGVDTGGAEFRMHAELVDALSTAPSRAEVRGLEEGVRNAQADYVGSQLTGDGVSVSRNKVQKAEKLLAEARRERHEDARMRVAQGHPTIYDLWEAQDRRDDAFFDRRKAVLDADAARAAYQSAPPDSVDQAGLHRRAVAADEASRRESAAQRSLDRAEIELADANNAWKTLRDEYR